MGSEVFQSMMRSVILAQKCLFTAANLKRLISRVVGVIGALCATNGAFIHDLSAQNAPARIHSEDVSYKHGGTKLKGFVAYQDLPNAARRPGILLVHEWWGHNDYVRERARQYAELGYVAFALDVYGAGKVTSDPKVATEWSKPFYADRTLFRDRLAAGLKQLTSHPLVDAKRVSALGYCFGGTAALELARAGNSLRSVISFHGGLSTPIPAKTGELKAEVLVLNGAEDPMVPQEERLGFMAEMRAAQASWEFIEYSGAVHAFTNRGADAFKIPGVAFNERAERRAWLRSVQFLEETLAP